MSGRARSSSACSSSPRGGMRNTCGLAATPFRVLRTETIQVPRHRGVSPYERPIEE